MDRMRSKQWTGTRMCMSDDKESRGAAVSCKIQSDELQRDAQTLRSQNGKEIDTGLRSNGNPGRGSGADRNTGIPHFDSKFEVEQHVRSLDMPYSTLRPVWFMSNWEGEQFKNMILGGTLIQPLSPDTTFQQIAVDDVGAFAVLAFQNPTAWIGREVEIAGDERSMKEVADVFSRTVGRQVTYRQMPWDDFREQAGDEYADMYRWFEDVGYRADVDALRSKHPGLQSFEEYLATQGWKDVATDQAAS